MLLWVRAVFLVTQGKRGISALEMYRQLEMNSYGTAWTMLHKIRDAMRQRDSRYQLKGVVELDGAFFGRRKTRNERSVMIAVETKKWTDKKGRRRTKAGFAKVMMLSPLKPSAQAFADLSVRAGSMIHTDGMYGRFNHFEHEARTCWPPEKSSKWLPWIHRFISNAKTFILGTHHGVEAKHLKRYLAEYAYRFNRRHDPDSLFARAVNACACASARPVHALLG
jgi:hypothetical protein